MLGFQAGHYPLADGESVLDCLLRHQQPVPYSCKAGVCCTCRGKVLQGSVHMDKNFTLSQAECEQGFVLPCQARATSADLVVSYDER